MLLEKFKIKDKAIRFFIHSLGCFILLYFLLNKLGIEKGLVDFIRTFLEEIFNTKNQIVILETSAEYKETDTKLFLHRGDIFNDIRFQSFNLKYLAYIPIIFFSSLVIASPITWFRKVKGFFIGIVILMIYITLITSTITRNLVFTLKEMAGLEFNTMIHDINTLIHAVLVEDGFQWNALAAIFIWLLTTIRLQDFK